MEPPGVLSGTIGFGECSASVWRSSAVMSSRARATRERTVPTG
ncbi:hypothetical protein ABT009_13240 [Streptomyces sp. NPDC002896]